MTHAPDGAPADSTAASHPGHQHHGHTAGAPATEGRVKDPVCGMEIDPADTSHRATQDGGLPDLRHGA